MFSFSDYVFHFMTWLMQGYVLFKLFAFDVTEMRRIKQALPGSKTLIDAFNERMSHLNEIRIHVPKQLVETKLKIN